MKILAMRIQFYLSTHIQKCLFKNKFPVSAGNTQEVYLVLFYSSRIFSVKNQTKVIWKHQVGKDLKLHVEHLLRIVIVSTCFNIPKFWSAGLKSVFWGKRFTKAMAEKHGHAEMSTKSGYINKKSC